MSNVIHYNFRKKTYDADTYEVVEAIFPPIQDPNQYLTYHYQWLRNNKQNPEI